MNHAHAQPSSSYLYGVRIMHEIIVGVLRCVYIHVSAIGRPVGAFTQVGNSFLVSIRSDQSLLCFHHTTDAGGFSKNRQNLSEAPVVSHSYGG